MKTALDYTRLREDLLAYYLMVSYGNRALVLPEVARLEHSSELQLEELAQRIGLDLERYEQCLN